MSSFQALMEAIRKNLVEANKKKAVSKYETALFSTCLDVGTEGFEPPTPSV